MILAVSNIAWDIGDEPAVLAMLRECGIAHLEVAPARVFPDPATATKEEAVGYAKTCRRHGLVVVAMQALLFGRSDLRLFASPHERDELHTYLTHMIRLGGAMGARVMVFGAPRNRRRGGLSPEQADRIAVPFFAGLASEAVEAGTQLVIEANPPHYGADYLVRAGEALELVRSVGSPGLGLHLDTACMTLVDDDVEALLDVAADLVAHVHVSEPDLGPVPGSVVDHRRFARALRAARYDRYVSIEMRPSPNPVSGVRRAVEHVRSVYRPEREAT